MSATLTLTTLADESFRLGLAVMLGTALERLSPSVALHITVLDLNLSARTRAALTATVAAHPGDHRIAFLRAEGTRTLTTLEPLLRRLNIRRPASDYFMKFVLFEELRDTPVCLFLDADIFVNCDLSEFPFAALDEHPLAAVLDASSVAKTMPDFLAAGLDGASPYFNAGVLGLRLDHWREARVLDRAMTMMPAMHEWFAAHAPTGAGLIDQSVLNAIFHGRWAQLASGWNRQCPVGYGVLLELQNPAQKLLHYLTRPKPWEMPVSDATRPFYDALDRTAFVGWRPRRGLVEIKNRLSYWKYRFDKWMKETRSRSA